MTARLAKLYNRFILGHPKTVLAVLAGIFICSIYYVRYFDLDASADSLLLENDKALQAYRKISSRYETKDYVFVVFIPNGDLFSDDSLNTIKAMRDDFRELADIDSVESLIDVPLVKQGSGKLSEVADNYRTLESPGVDREKAREELIHSPIFNELIISKDGTTTALQLNLKEDPEYTRIKRERNRLLIKKYSAEFTEQDRKKLEHINAAYNTDKEKADNQIHNTLARIRDIMDRYRSHGKLYLGGVPMIADDMISYVKNDLMVFGIGVFVFLVGMLTIIFRKLRWVVLPLLSCIFAGLLMMGLLGLIGWKVTVISSNFISLMLIITMSMNVHLIVRYRQLRRDSPDLNHHELVHEMASKMVWPCLYTALTTMIGFGSLVVSDIKPVIDFGWMMTLGLAVTFLTSFLLFPAILVMLGKTRQAGVERKEVPFTATLASVTVNHGNKVVIIALILGAVSIFGISRLKVENSFVNYFSDSTEIYQGLKLIDDKLGGTTSLDIILSFPEQSQVHADEQESGDDDELDFGDLESAFGSEKKDKSDYWFTTEKINTIKKVQDYLESLPAVGKVLSLASTIRVAEDLNKGQPFDAFEMAILYKRLPETLKETMITPYVSIENNEARITLRVKDSMKNLRRKELLDKIHGELTEKLGIPEKNLQMTGLLVLYNNMLQSLFKSQIETLGVVMLGIALMLLILFRSASLAVIGIIPNILAAAIILGLMGLLNIPLDMMTITISAITLGIAVDNSIHYIYRFREEFARTGNYLETLYYCHANIGRAVFYTAITIIVGFSIMVLSNFIPTIYFGLLTALAMFIALLAALTLLPKLILIWKPF